MDFAERVERERFSYDQGDIVQEMLALQSRFPHVFKCPNSQRAEMFLDSMLERHIKGKHLLDYGCQNGSMVERYTKFGAAGISGIDISEAGIREATEKYSHLASFQVADAHNLPFADDCFDAVVGRSILHHLEFETAITEVTRILKPGGWAIFMEPLGDNPAGKLMRRLTPRARTRDERPLSRSQIEWGDRWFGNSAHWYFNLLSVPLAMVTSHTGLGPDNLLLYAADIVDVALAKTITKYWMRQTILVWQKTSTRPTRLNGWKAPAR
jgi:ubiquinone/menaquinone biosynthesis C-methylase UbiE